MSGSWKKVVVFLGSTRQNRLGERVAKFVVNKLKEKKLDVVLIGKYRFVILILMFFAENF